MTPDPPDPITALQEGAARLRPNAGDLMVYETMALYLRRRGEHAEADAMEYLVAEVRRLRAYSASGTEHRAKAADAVQQASGGYFVSTLNRREVEEVVAIVDNTLLQERRA